MISNIKEIVKAIVLGVVRIYLYILYFISGLVERDPNIWVFGSWHGKRFADNSKYFFIYCNKYKKKNSKIRYIWISRNKDIVNKLREIGYEAYYAYSLRGLMYSLKAKVYVYDSSPHDINYWTSRNSFKINLWHGIPLKKIGRDIKDPTKPLYKVYYGNIFYKLMYAIRAPWMLTRPDIVISTSRYVSRIFARAFDVLPENVVITGYPRNDILLAPDPLTFLHPKLEVYQLYKKLRELKKHNKKIVIYLPTFRDSAVNKGRVIPLDWKFLDEFLQANSTVLIFKPHSVDKILMDRSNFSNIIILPDRVDIHPLLKLTDILITDYSSIYFDFLLLKKPIIFFVYDLDEYIKKDRSLYERYEDVTPGYKIKSQDELILILETFSKRSKLELPKTELKKFKKIIRKYHKYLDGKASERVYRTILDHIHKN